MSFNLVSSLLCVSSDTETVHIFKLSSGAAPGTSGSNGNYNGGMVTYEKGESGSESRGRSSSVG